MAVISIAQVFQAVSCGIVVVPGDVNKCLDKKRALESDKFRKCWDDLGRAEESLVYTFFSVRRQESGMVECKYLEHSGQPEVESCR